AVITNPLPTRKPVAYPLGPTSNKTEMACSSGFCSFFENSNSSDNVYRSCCFSIRLALLLSAADTGASNNMTRAAIQVRLQSLLFIVDLRSSLGNDQDDLVHVGVRTKRYNCFDNQQGFTWNLRPEHFRAGLGYKQRFFGNVRIKAHIRVYPR